MLYYVQFTYDVTKNLSYIFYSYLTLEILSKSKFSEI